LKKPGGNIKVYQILIYIMNSIDTTNIDSIVKSVLNKFVQRSIIGKKKYNTDLDRTDLHVTDWITHAQDELMDAILYLEKLKTTIL